jgi:hypothetical protein
MATERDTDDDRRMNSSQASLRKYSEVIIIILHWQLRSVSRHCSCICSCMRAYHQHSDTEAYDTEAYDTEAYDTIQLSTPGL